MHDAHFRAHSNAFPEDRDAAAALLREAFASLQTWTQLGTMIAEHASEAITKAEKEAMFHEFYGRDHEAIKALERIPKYQEWHRLGHLIRHVDTLEAVADVAAYVKQRHAKLGSQPNPLDVSEHDDKPRRK